VENLLNKQYATPFNQISVTNSFYFAGRGTTASIGYSIYY
jgi:hypothetical protein